MLSKKCCQKRGIQKKDKKRDGHIEGRFKPSVHYGLALSLLERNLKKAFYRRGVPAQENRKQKRLCGLWRYRRYPRRCTQFKAVWRLDSIVK